MPEEKTDRPQEGAGEPEAPREAAPGSSAEGPGPQAGGEAPSEASEPAGEPLASGPAAEGETGSPAPGSAGAPAPARRPRRPRPGWLCTAHYSKMSRVGQFAAPGEGGFEHGRKVVLRTERGTEMGTIVSSPLPLDLAGLPRRPGEVLRAAGREDIERQRSIEEEIEPAELKECQQEVAAQGLPMKLVAVEHILGGEKIVFYFMADGRVDFRRLVRDVARKYRTRIEFRQIGVRDEARLLADYEHCGQPLCCKQFLRGLEPVTMRMAKLQKATLDPAKISGRCGRLMCCLRFEEVVYRELGAKLPARGAYVLTEAVAGQVVSGEVITQKVTLRAGPRRVTVGVEEIKEISDKPLQLPVAPAGGRTEGRKPTTDNRGQPATGDRRPGPSPRPSPPGRERKGEGRGRRRGGRSRRGGRRSGTGGGPRNT